MRRAHARSGVLLRGAVTVASWGGREGLARQAGFLFPGLRRLEGEARMGKGAL